MDQIEIHQVRYNLHLRDDGDIWMLSGVAFGHPNFQDGERINVSTPVAYNKETQVLNCSSGRTYFICSFQQAEEEVVVQIEKDIASGGYEVR